MRRKKNNVLSLGMTVLVLAVTCAGCYKEFVPKEQDYFSRNMNYSRNNFPMILGRNNIYINLFNADYSTQPLDFTIENPRHAADSSPAPELLSQVQATMWKDYYTGYEQSIEEIDAKRYTDKKPALDIRPHSGEIVFWKTDSNTVKPGLYSFDVRVKNGGGEKVFPMVLDVRLPHPYDPWEYDDITGEMLPSGRGGVLHPTTMDGVTDMLNREMPPDSVNVYFHKTGDKANTLTIKFFDQDSLPIPLSRFNMMQWDSLRYHSGMTGADVFFGFNRKMSNDSTAVTFDITNPFPALADVSSDKASIIFPYNRVYFGSRVNAYLGFSFAIFEPGEWELIFKFRTNPRFEDD